MKITRRILLTLLFLSLQFIPYLSAEDYNRWHLPEGAKLRFGKGILHDIKFTPDGDRIAVATSIGIWIYDAQTGQEISLLTGHTGRVTSLGFPADGRFLASGSADGTIRLWDIDTGKQIALLTGHRGRIQNIAVSPDGRSLVSSDTWKSTLILWDTEAGEQIKRHSGFRDDPIRRFRTFFSLRRWTSKPNVNMIDAGDPSFIDALAFSPDGTTFASGHGDGVRIWSAASGRKLSTLRKHTYMDIRMDIRHIRSLAFSPDGKTLASSSPNATLLHTLQKGEPLSHKGVHHAHFPENLVFSPDGTRLIGTGGYYEEDRDTFHKGWDTHIHVWKVDTGALLTSFPTHDKSKRVEALALSPDGGTLLTGGWEGAIHSWDLATGTYSTFTTGHGRGDRALEFLKDGRTLTSWKSGDQQKFWDTTTGAQIGVPVPQTTSEKQVMRSPNRAISAKIDGDRKYIQVRDAATGSEMYRITGHKGKIWTYAHSPDGKTLASTGEDMTIRLWDVVTGDEMLRLHTHTHVTVAIAFSPDGKTLAGGSVYDHTQGGSNLIRLWELPNGGVLTTLHGHTGNVNALRFSPDGKTLASSSGDGTILLWDLDKIAESE